MNKYKANKVTVNSPIYTGVTHTFLMTDNQLAIYNELTNNGTEQMTLKLFAELTRRGCLRKLYFEKKAKIKVH